MNFIKSDNAALSYGNIFELPSPVRNETGDLEFNFNGETIMAFGRRNTAPFISTHSSQLVESLIGDFKIRNIDTRGDRKLIFEVEKTAELPFDFSSDKDEEKKYFLLTDYQFFETNFLKFKDVK